MDFKKKWQRFWTLDRHHAEGFTLVELVIVIAIMAILAGVAVPAYNGYIKKARTAADQQIIAAANEAFASACMESKVDVMYVTEATITVDSQKIYGLSSVTAPATGTSAEADIATIAPAFEKYYAEGNGALVFKTENVNSLIWNVSASSFEMKDAFVAARVVLSDGTVISVSAADIEKARESGLSILGVSGVEKAMAKMNATGKTLSTAVSVLKKFDSLANGLTAFGVMTPDEAKALGDILEKDPTNEAALAKASNGLQLVVAKYVSDNAANTEKINKLLDQDLGSSSAELGTKIIGTQVTLPIVGTVGEPGIGGTVGTSALAMQYAIAESYVARHPEAADLLKNEDPVAAVHAVQNHAGYASYKGSADYTNDVAGFMGTLNAVNSNTTANTENPAAKNDYITNGISGEAGNAILSSLLGSGTTSSAS